MGVDNHTHFNALERAIRVHHLCPSRNEVGHKAFVVV
jgi:hypothetical protein